MAVTHDTLQVYQQLRAQLVNLTDQQARDLVASYARAWDEVAGEMDAALMTLVAAAQDGRLSRTKVAKSARLRAALTVIGERLEQLATDAGVRIIGDLDQAVRIAGEAEAALIGTTLPPTTEGVALLVTFDKVNADAITAIIDRTTQRIHALTKPLAPDAVATMKRELVRGVTVGDNPRETARRILARTQGTFEGGAARATTIAQTETLDAMRAAASVTDRANPTVTGWQWIAELGPRTCPACFAMHATTHALTDPGPQGHQRCRCTRIPVTMSWTDLGFDGIEEPPDLMPDAKEFFNGLTPDEQVGILGRDGLTAYQAGAFPMDDWATKRSTPGWRDSYVPAKPPRSASLAS